MKNRSTQIPEIPELILKDQEVEIVNPEQSETICSTWVLCLRPIGFLPAE